MIGKFQMNSYASWPVTLPLTFIVLYFRLFPNMDDRTHPFTL